MRVWEKSRHRQTYAISRLVLSSRKFRANAVSETKTPRFQKEYLRKTLLEEAEHPLAQAPSQPRQGIPIAGSIPLVSDPRPSQPQGPKTVTGIGGFDQILNGGIPQGRVVLILGGPGTGKTILCTQFLVNGIHTFGEPGVYISLDEDREHLVEEMKGFGWDLEALEESGRFAFIDASPAKFVPPQIRDGRLVYGRNSLTVSVLAQMIRSSVQKVHAKRLVIDPVTALGFPYPGAIQRRYALVELMAAIRGTGVTALVTAEIRKNGFDRMVGAEEYLAHGVVVLQQMPIGKSFLRVIQVEKMRRTSVDTQPRPYAITRAGIEVYAKESIL